MSINIQRLRGAAHCLAARLETLQPRDLTREQRLELAKVATQIKHLLEAHRREDGSPVQWPERPAVLTWPEFAEEIGDDVPILELTKMLLWETLWRRWKHASGVDDVTMYLFHDLELLAQQLVVVSA